MGNREHYAPAEREVADEVIREAIKPTYLGSMLRQLRDALTAQKGGTTVDEGEGQDQAGDEG